MANNFNTNPMQLDTAGAGSGIATDIAGIIVIANANSWSCILKDASGGDVIFRADSAIASDRFVSFAPTTAIPVSGVYVDTLTNIAQVLFYQA